MQISGSNGTTKPADYQPGINNMGLFNYAKSVVSTAVNTPVHALLRSFRDNVLAEHVTPVPGSVLYCDLAAGYAVGKKSVARVALELVWDRIWVGTTLQLTTVICSPVCACVKKSRSIKINCQCRNDAFKLKRSGPESNESRRVAGVGRQDHTDQLE